MKEWIETNLATIIVGLIGIAVALLIYFRQKRPKSLDFTVMYNAPMLSRRAKGSDVRVVYDEQELADPHIVAVRIRNTGKEPITSDEYVQGITIRYEGGGPPLDVSVPQESEPNLAGPILLQQNEQFLEVTPQLMNAKDWFDLQIISDGEPDKIVVSSRFAGQTRPMRDLDPLPTVGFITIAAGMLIAVFAGGGGSIIGSDSAAQIGLYGGMLVSSVGFAHVLYRIARTPGDKNVDMPGGFF